MFKIVKMKKLILKIILIIIFTMNAYYTTKAKFSARIVGIFVADSELPYTLEMAKPAIDIAIEKAKVKYPLISWDDGVFKNGSNRCTSNFAGVFAAEEFYLRRVSVFIGPSCGLALDPVARMAAYWNIPVISSGGVHSQFSNKDIFTTLTRLSFSMANLGSFVKQLLHRFSWTHLAVVVHETVNSSLTPLMSKMIVNALDPELDISVDIHEITRLEKANLKSILHECSKEARVILLLSSGEVVRKLLLAAYDLGMNDGVYAFLTIELFKHRNSFGNFDWFIPDDPRNNDVKTMYESLMIITVYVPMSADYLQFIDEVIEKSRIEFNTSFGRQDVNVILAGFHDSVLLYGQALTETIMDEKNPIDGFSLSRRLWNRSFSGLLSGDIYIDSNGDKETDYTLNDFDVNSLEMKPVMYYSGFYDQIVLANISAIHWPNDYGPPIDPSVCELNEDDPSCYDEKPLIPYIQGFVFIIILCVVVLVVFIVIYRKFRLETELSSMWWKVKWNEITIIDETQTETQTEDFIHHLNQTNAYNNNKTNKVNSYSDNTKIQSKLFTIHVDSREKELFQKEMSLLIPKKGMFKGIKVFIKPLNIRHMSINRTVLLELKQLRDLAHENLIRFIGFCPEDPYIALLTEYCEKGNLRDLLDNKGIRIDWPFRYSLIGDIVEGMCFIHESSLNFHSRLKSTNCVVDSRLVVKLTDFGLRSLRNQSVQLLNETDYESLLWTAPEHLKQRRPDLSGSQKGDVYSFSIVLQEIITRTRPFHSAKLISSSGQISILSLEPKYIIQQLRIGGENSCRPYVDNQDCSNDLIDLMVQCWDDSLSIRPSFSLIKQQFKKITKDIGIMGNFLENLLLRMEEYANDLEILVEQKTSAFFEEKRKCEELLYEVLPKTVADQLKVGHHVTPETFECVTIFFSDIVQFTQLSAESTPMEIVDFLNDLYTLFDSIIGNYDVYKVETIGDAYMVVSGLPIRNGDNHAREIARMSLELLEGIKKFDIKHIPDRKVELRIGVHTGPCAAGVIGMKMPRYCLFGDTVNTASRMESHGEANKIHVSAQTKAILDKFNAFKLKLRGDIDLKGKGRFRTYWLEYEDNNNDIPLID